VGGGGLDSVSISIGMVVNGIGTVSVSVAQIPYATKVADSVQGK
jgi:hypothetical protein